MVISHHMVGQWRPTTKVAGKLPQELTGSNRVSNWKQVRGGVPGGGRGRRGERRESTWPLPVPECEGFQAEVPGTSATVGNPAS